jgi:hypothetical protein
LSSPAAWKRGEEEKGEGVLGFIGEVLNAIYLREMKRGVIIGVRYWKRREREGIAGEIDDRWGQAVGERGGELGWAGSGVSWAGWLPGAAQVGCWLFLFCFLFLLFLISVLGF